MFAKLGVVRGKTHRLLELRERKLRLPLLKKRAPEDVVRLRVAWPELADRPLCACVMAQIPKLAVS